MEATAVNEIWCDNKSTLLFYHVNERAGLVHISWTYISHQYNFILFKNNILPILAHSFSFRKIIIFKGDSGGGKREAN